MREEQVRAAMINVETALGQLTTSDNSPQVVVLQGAWTQLVSAMALGPAPELRDCPHCGRSGRAAASVCGFCWARLVPKQ